MTDENSHLRRGYFFMLLLALQFGLQPVFTKEFVDKDVDKAVFVLALEALKFTLGLAILVTSGSLRAEAARWTLGSSLSCAALPAGIYAVQNVLIQIAYQNLSGLMFNLINQTKTLFAAGFVWFFLGRGQSAMQCVALSLLAAATLVLTLSGSSTEEQAQNSFSMGVLPIVAASALSGLASALCQRATQAVSGGAGRNATVFSMELAVYSGLSLVAALATSGRLVPLLQEGALAAWTPGTLIPLSTQAFGGMVIGQVTKYAGSVRKGFAVCFGIVVTAFAQNVVYGSALLPKHVVGLVLVVASVWLHASFPLKKAPAPLEKAKKAQ